jgi:primosomal protein N'
MAAMVLSDRDFEKLQPASNNIRRMIDSIIQRHNLEAIVRGPAPAVISRIQRLHRMQIIIQTPSAQVLQKLFGFFREISPVRHNVKVVIDIDPINLL